MFLDHDDPMVVVLVCKLSAGMFSSPLANALMYHDKNLKEE